MPKGELPENQKGITAKQYIMESLRQKCLYDITLKSQSYDANFTVWFDYMLNYIDECGSFE